MNGYKIDYTNEYGDYCLSGNFSLEQARDMLLRLYEGEAWGKVSSVNIRPSGEPLDTRSIHEIESNVIS